MAATRTRWVVGCMTGTSLDGLDAALVEITGEGLGMTAKFHRLVSKPLAGLASTLRHFAECHAAPPIDYMRAARQLGELHAEAVAELIGDAKIDFVVAHGQTIWHAPPSKAGNPESRKAGNVVDAGLSWQLFDPWPLVRRLRVPVCYDLRQADLIAGGEGAPITPLADWVMYRVFAPASVVNLGGICNVTAIQEDWRETNGLDIGPCNILLDGLTQRLFSEPFDREGQFASQGQIDTAVLDEIFSHPKLSQEQCAGSLGREDFSESWLDHLVARLGPTHSPHDILASAVDVIAGLIHYWWSCDPGGEVILAGGGVRNRALIERIRHYQGDATRLTDDLGIPCDAREAAAFAVLGALSHDGVGITLPQVTGACAPGQAGAWAFP